MAVGAAGRRAQHLPGLRRVLVIGVALPCRTGTRRLHSLAPAIISSPHTQHFRLFYFDVAQQQRGTCLYSPLLCSLCSGRRKPGMGCRTDSAPGSGRPHWCRGINQAGTLAERQFPEAQLWQGFKFHYKNGFLARWDDSKS